jgi:hypothetical protein
VKENFSVEKMVDAQYNLYLKLTDAAGVQASACSLHETGQSLDSNP